MSRTWIYPVPCPDCNQPAGEPCTSTLTHLSRVEETYKEIHRRIDERLGADV